MKHNILLVEDDQDIRENTTEMLEMYDYAVTNCSNGKEALELAASSRPDLILCDIRMPVMDGYTFLEKIKSLPALQGICFIFFSAFTDKRDIDTGLSLGANDYLIKPFTMEALLGKLRKVLALPPAGCYQP